LVLGTKALVEEILLFSCTFLQTSEQYIPWNSANPFHTNYPDHCIWGSHSSCYEKFYLRGYNAIYSGESQHMFQRNVSLLAACFMLVSCLNYSLTLKVKAICSSETLMTFTGLHGIISQQIKRFIPDHPHISFDAT
jgi:hypothetical protein